MTTFLILFAQLFIIVDSCNLLASCGMSMFKKKHPKGFCALQTDSASSFKPLSDAANWLHLQFVYKHIVYTV